MTPAVFAIDASAMKQLQDDVFAPMAFLTIVQDDAEAMALDRVCPYALGAAVFASKNHGEKLARSIDAGLVLVNDIIVPLSDPRVALSPRHRSGHGVTRGEAGLLAMTKLKVVCQRSGKWRPHFDPMVPEDAAIFESYLNYAHGEGFGHRVQSLFKLISALMRRGKS